MTKMPILAAVFGLALFAAPTANAFTLEGQSATNSDGSARYTDPDKRFSDQKDGQKTLQSGNTTIKFGGDGSFGQRYNPNSMFDPIGRPQTER